MALPYIDPFNYELIIPPSSAYPFYNPEEYVQSLVQYTDQEATALLASFVSQALAEDQSYLTSFFSAYTTVEMFKTKFPVDMMNLTDTNLNKFLRNLTAEFVLKLYQVMPNNPYLNYLMEFVSQGIFSPPTVANFEAFLDHFMVPIDYPRPPTLSTVEQE